MRRPVVMVAGALAVVVALTAAGAPAAPPAQHHLTLGRAHPVSRRALPPTSPPSGFTGAAGPPPLGAGGPPPLGAAGPPPLGAAGPPPLGATGGVPHFPEHTMPSGAPCVGQDCGAAAPFDDGGNGDGFQGDAPATMPIE